MSLASSEQEQRAKPLRCWTAQQTEAVCASAEGVLRGWCTAWDIDPQGVRVLVLQGDAPLLPAPDAWQRALQSALFGGTPSAAAPNIGGPVSRQVRAEAWADLRSRARAWAGCDVFELSESSQPLGEPQAWSGDLVLRWHCAGLEGVWPLAGDAVVRLAPPLVSPPPALAPKVDMGQALAAHVLTVRTSLAPVSLRLGDLASLGLGDIVKLPHSLDQPLHLSLPDGDAPLCAGWLGQRHGQKALELTPAPATTAPLAS
jgi:hypothetical protein